MRGLRIASRIVPLAALPRRGGLAAVLPFTVKGPSWTASHDNGGVMMIRIRLAAAC
jgi:hypothetical protein